MLLCESKRIGRDPLLADNGNGGTIQSQYQTIEHFAVQIEMLDRHQVDDRYANFFLQERYAFRHERVASFPQPCDALH